MASDKTKKNFQNLSTVHTLWELWNNFLFEIMGQKLVKNWSKLWKIGKMVRFWFGWPNLLVRPNHRTYRTTKFGRTRRRTGKFGRSLLCALSFSRMQKWPHSVAPQLSQFDETCPCLPCRPFLTSSRCSTTRSKNSIENIIYHSSMCKNSWICALLLLLLLLFYSGSRLFISFEDDKFAIFWPRRAFLKSFCAQGQYFPLHACI